MPESVYLYAGLRIESPIPLPGPCVDCHEPDVRVTLGKVSEKLDSPRVQGDGFEGQPGRWLGRPTRRCRTEVIDGLRIVLDAEPQTPPRRLQVALEQSVIALLHMRGALPLHASAVQNEGSAWLFLGPNMAGKSSLAAALAVCGACAVCDDLCAVSADTHALLLGGTGVLKVGVDFGGESAARLEGDRRGRRALEIAPSGPLPVAGIFCLVPGENFQLDALKPRDALQVLLGHSYGPTFAKAFGTEKTFFAHLTRLLSLVRVQRLAMAQGASSISQTARWLMRQGHLSALPC